MTKHLSLQLTRHLTRHFLIFHYGYDIPPSHKLNYLRPLLYTVTAHLNAPRNDFNR